MIRTMFAVLLAGVASAAGAAEYFIDAELGNDAADGRVGTRGGSASGPWRSLGRAVAAPLKPGDILSLRCGRIWRESLDVPAAQAWKRVIVRGYGDDCSQGVRPEIRPTKVITTWEAAEGGFAGAAVERPVGQVWIVGIRAVLARYPDSGFVTMSAGEGANRRRADVLPGSRALALSGSPEGATAVVRTTAWSLEIRRVAGRNPDGDLRLESDVKYGIQPGFGYYLENQRWMLSRPEEWVFDAARRQLVLGDRPERLAGRVVEAAQFDAGIALRGATEVEIRQVRVHGAGQTGIVVDRSQGVVLQDVEVTGSGLDGVRIEDSPLTSVLAARIAASIRDGVVFVRSPGSRIAQSTVEDSGNADSPKPHFAAVNATASDDLVIEQNVVRRSGYIGIRFKRATRVLRNRVEDSCLVLDDCGAIYTWSMSDPLPPFASFVEENIVSGAPGNESGRPPGPGITAGIYLDDLSSGIEVRGNTVTGTQRGLFLHNTRDVLAEANILVGNRWCQVMLSESGEVPAGTMQRNRITGNFIVASPADAAVIVDGTKGRDALGQFDGNRYVNAFTNDLMRVQVLNGGVRSNRLFDLEAMREIGMERKGAAVSAVRVRTPGGRNLVPNGSLAAGAAQWQAWDKQGVTKLRLSSECDTVSPCLTVDYPPQHRGLVNTGAFPVSRNTRYLIRASLRAPEGAAVVEISVRRARPPYDGLGLARSVALRAAWSTVALEYVAGEDEPQARMDIAFQSGTPKVQIGPVAVVPAGGEGDNPADPLRLLINPEPGSRLVTCPDKAGPSCARYRDLDGRPVDWPVTIPAFASRVLLLDPTN